jgi:nucleotide-binding universal stress UspA family protein
LLIVAVVFGSQLSRGAVSGGLALALGLGAAIVLPVLNVISLVIPNAAGLLFPAWFQAGKGGPQGIEATGQRIIFALGQFLAFMIALVPAAGVGTVIFFLVKFLAGTAVAVIGASTAATVVLALEAGLGVMLLGWLFERFDVAAEQTA